MLSTMILTAGTLFYSIISWPWLIIADMASIDVSLGVLACVVTAGDKARTFSISVYLNRCSLGIIFWKFYETTIFKLMFKTFYMRSKIYCKSEVYIDVGIGMGNLPNSNVGKTSNVECKKKILI